MLKYLAITIFLLILDMRSLASDASSAVNIILGVLGKAEPVEVKIKGELVQEAQCQRPIIWSHLRINFVGNAGDKNVTFSTDVTPEAKFIMREKIKHGEYLVEVQDTRTFKTLLRKKTVSTAFGNLKLVIRCNN
jgi:hypothetical protein